MIAGVDDLDARAKGLSTTPIVMFCRPCRRLTMHCICKQCGEETIPAWPNERFGVTMLTEVTP